MTRGLGVQAALTLARQLGITEDPFYLASQGYIARLTPGTDPPRFQIFGLRHGMGPIGYLEIVSTPAGPRIRVEHASGQVDAGTVPDYRNALLRLRQE